MYRGHRVHRLRFLFLAIILALVPAAAASPKSTPARATGALQRLILRAKSPADYASLRQSVLQSGAQLVIDQPAVNLMVIATTDSGLKPSLALSPYAGAVGSDHIEQLVRPAMQEELFGKAFSTVPQITHIEVSGGPALPLPFLGDPAFSLPGLMWNVSRINSPRAWQHINGGGMGMPYVKVAVADTGLDYTHIELANRVDWVKDFTIVDEVPPICTTFFGSPSDAQLATAFGAPSANLDFNGHGTWIGGNIAASLNLTGTNGIAPKVDLVSLKISQNCGSAYDSTILDAFIYAANQGIDIVSISFGGYLDKSDPDQALIYQAYVDVAAYARSKGTLIVAAAGNEHTRIGAGGQVISHGILSSSPGGTDNYGLWEVPGGVPGVVDVAATGNVVNAASSSCPADSLAATSHQWCKPASDPHQPFGVGLQNQLTYYSNYGPRIDFAAPGGARKFNLPAMDRGGSEGWPWTGSQSIYGGTSVVDGYNAWEDFSITSNYSTQIPCFTFTGSLTFPNNQCFAIIQGTSMATPHVAAAFAILASSMPDLWHKPDALVSFLKMHTTPISGNTTPPVSQSDTTNGDSGGTCPKGYCHLGGAPVPDVEAYGAGLVDVSGPFWPKVFVPLALSK